MAATHKHDVGVTRKHNPTRLRCATPVFLDHVRDGVRSRLWGVLTVAMVFCIAIWLIFAAFFRDPTPFYGQPAVVQVTVALVPPARATLIAARALANVDSNGAVLPAAKFRALNFQGFGVGTARIRASIGSFQVALASGTQFLPCGAAYPESAVLAQYEFLCSALDVTVDADPFGVVTFVTLPFARSALAGQYNVTFTELLSGLSEAVLVRLDSDLGNFAMFAGPALDVPLPVYSLVPLNANASNALRASVTDATGAPAANRVVRAVVLDVDGSSLTLPEFWSPLAPSVLYMYDPEKDKAAVLGGDVVETNEFGEAIFDSFRVVGSSSVQVFVGFTCEGLLVPVAASPTYGLLFVSTVTSVAIVTEPSDAVIEGELLAVQPRVRVLSATGAPVVGEIVFAQIARVDGLTVPSFYASQPPPLGSVKTLLGAISEPTDANGEVAFTELRFSQFGPSGTLTISFRVGDAVSVESQPVAVSTTVAAVELVWDDTVTLTLPQVVLSSPTVLVRDAAGAPVYGKSPALLLTPDWRAIALPVASTRSGVAFFSFLYIAAAANPTINFSVTVDGVAASAQVVLAVTPIAPVGDIGPAYIDLLSVPTSVAAGALTTVFASFVGVNAAVIGASVADLTVPSLDGIPSVFTYLPTQYVVTSSPDAGNASLVVAALDSNPNTRVVTPYPVQFSMTGYPGRVWLGVVGSQTPIAISHAYPLELTVAFSLRTSRVEQLADTSFLVTLRDAGGAPVVGQRVTVQTTFVSSLDLIYLNIFGLFGNNATLGAVPPTVFASPTAMLTNASGQALFAPLLVGPAFPGLHEVYFMAGNMLLPFLVPLANSASNARVLPTITGLRLAANITIVIPAAYASVGVTGLTTQAPLFTVFTTSPVVRVLDATGQPVVGLRVIATTFAGGANDTFSNPFDVPALVGRLTAEPGSDQVGSFYSEPTDAAGLASWPGLGFVVHDCSLVNDGGATSAAASDDSSQAFVNTTAGCTYQLRYISDFGTGRVADAGEPNLVVAAYDTPVLTIVQQPSLTVSVGIPFATPLVVAIRNAAGSPATVSLGLVSIGSAPDSVSPATLSSSIWPVAGGSQFAFTDLRFLSADPGVYTLEVQFPGAVSVRTSEIRVVDKPALILIRTQPPSTVRLGTVFTLTIESVILSGAPIANVSVSVSLVRNYAVDALPELITLDAYTAVQLDSAFVVNTTDASGQCAFSISIAAAPSGTYFVVFRAGNAISTPSRNFAVANPVAAVTVVSAPRALGTLLLAAEKTVLLTDEGDRGASSMAQPVVRVTDASGAALAGVPVTALVSSEIQTNGTLEGSTVPSLTVLFSNPTLGSATAVTDSDGFARFTSLVFLSGSTGSYRLFFRARGVDSPVSAPLRLTNVLLPDSSNVSKFRSFVIVVLLITLPLLFANIVLNTRVALAVAVLFVTGILVFVLVFLAAASGGNSARDPFEIMLTVLAAVSVLLACVLLFIVAVRAVRNTPTSHMHTREARAFSSVRRLLSPRYVADFWATRARALAASRTRKLRRACIGKVPEWVRNELGLTLDDPPRDEFEPFEQKGDFLYPQRFLVGGCISLFFTLVMLLACVVLTLWVRYAVDESFNKILTVQLVLERTSQVLRGTAATLFGTAGTVDGNLQAVLQKGDTVVGYFVNLIRDDQVLYLKTCLVASAALAIVVATGFVLVMGVLMASQYRRNIFLLRRGQARAIFFDASAYDALSASAWIGIQSVHTLLGYLLCFATMWVVWFCVIFSPLRVFLWTQLWPIVLGLFSLNLVMNIIQSQLIARFVVGKEGPFSLPHMRFWLLYEMIYTFLNVVDGLSMTIARLTFGLVSILVLFLRTDTPIASMKRESGDPAFSAYIAMLLLDFNFNSPVVVVASEIFLQLLRKARRKAGADDVEDLPLNWAQPNSTLGRQAETAVRELSVRARARWFLATTLARNPDLIRQRYGYLVREAKRRELVDERGLANAHGLGDDPRDVDSADNVLEARGVQLGSIN